MWEAFGGVSEGHAQYREVLREHYVPKLREHGAMHRAVDWGSQKSQKRRFDVLLDVDDVRAASILDVGCGFGALCTELDARGYAGEYLGIDPIAEMVEAARTAHPLRRFDVGLIEEARPEWSADYVLASGIFTLADEATLQREVRALYACARRAVAFNVLSVWGEAPVDGEFVHDPLRILDFARSLTPWVRLRHDYMPHDFSVYMYREAR